MRVSTLLLTYNEEANIGPCLDALSWCDDILVLDSGSSDQTVAIALTRGVRILVRPFDDFAEQRNFGLEMGNFKHEWVLHLDADEIATPSFAHALDILEPLPGIDGWRVPSKLMLFGRWLRHAGMYPTYQVRLGHRDRLRFKQVGHGQQEDAEPHRIATFSEPYLHNNFSHGLRRWLEKHARYAEDEARALIVSRTARVIRAPNTDSTSRRRRLKRLTNRIPLWLRPVSRVFYLLVVRMGFRDGRAGLLYAFMLSVYDGMIAVFVYSALLEGKEPGRQLHQATHPTEVDGAR